MFLREILDVLRNQCLTEFNNNVNLTLGLQYGTYYPEKHIKKVLLTVTPSLECIHYAIRNKFNLVISYFELIENHVNKIKIPLLEKLSLLSRGSLYVYILNKSFIFSSNGLSNTLNRYIHFVKKEFIQFRGDSENCIFGDICIPRNFKEPKNLPDLKTLLKRIKTNFNIENLPYIGHLEKEINKICVLVTQNVENIDFLEGIEANIDCFLVNKISQENAFLANDSNIVLIQYPFFKILSLCIESLANNLSLEFPYDEFEFFHFQNPLSFY